MPDEPQPEESVVSILIVARYASVRAGLAVMLRDVDGFEVVGEVGNSADLADVLESRVPTIVLIDVDESELPFALNPIRQKGLPVVAFTEAGDHPSTHDLDGLPGWALLPRNAEPVHIILAVRAAAAGLAVVDAASSRGPLRSLSTAVSDRPDEEPLSPRERQILQLLAQGLPNKSIAARLDISPHTVKFHVTSIMNRLHAASRTEAVTIGARRGEVKL